jgi:3-phosphoshikimate 1-carboxyvinyltransferase
LNVSIHPTRKISGEIRAPPSKALTHRALFAGLLSNGRTIIRNPLSCDDTKATINVVSSLGAVLTYEKERWDLESLGVLRPPRDSIDCGESGVTLRFGIPVASFAGVDVRLRARTSLLRRPLQHLIEAMGHLGVRADVKGSEVIVEASAPKGGRVQLPGDISSQFVSGLLLAGPLMKDGLEIILTSPLESCGYVSLTIEMLKQHGISVEAGNDSSSFRIAPGQVYRPAEHVIPGDYSSAAFLMSAAAVTGSEMRIAGLPEVGLDPDAALLGILAEMGASSQFSSGTLRVEGRGLKSTRVNVSDCPDLGPIVAVLGCYAKGKTELTGAARLRYKESNRLASIASELKALGAEALETDGGLVITGGSTLHGGTVESHGDHRIAMALSIAALHASDTVTIRGSQCVNKSYPSFFEDLRSLGVEVVER